VTLAEDLAGDLRAARGTDFNELGRRPGQMILPREEVSGDGLQMTVGEPATRMKWRELGRQSVAGTAHPFAPRDVPEGNAAARC